MGKILWKKNKWSIEIENTDIFTNLVGVSDGWHLQNPILYSNGTLGWDDPYSIPEYVKDKTGVIMRRLKRKGMGVRRR